tara:strand:+ start:17312 stop:17578 length:267 start_codon:yes stop_codon:yes gene_type:complete
MKLSVIEEIESLTNSEVKKLFPIYPYEEMELKYARNNLCVSGRTIRNGGDHSSGFSHILDEKEIDFVKNYVYNKIIEKREIVFKYLLK